MYSSLRVTLQDFLILEWVTLGFYLVRLVRKKKEREREED